MLTGYGTTRWRKNDEGELVKTRFHPGVDLAGAMGDPIYAQFDRTIGDGIVSEQPDRDNNGEYPSDYTGDKNAGGNKISIVSTINGSEVKNSYMHLQAGTPIANNPRTGNPWAEDDEIHAGEVIGYIGITGNADPAIPHLHLNTKVNGANVNPATYLNATVSTTTTTITTPCD